ncbi:MAG TPA: protein kinase [Kofleriaceae bacterium]|nr:protein kinase [Kofleriaceae bacterium]
MTRYELLDRIGVGGMAEIFRGKAVAAGGFEKPVAIKRILPHLSQDRRFVELLIAEAKVLSLLKHRNIVQIFDVGLGDDGQYFLVMEFVDGKDLGAVQRALEQQKRRRMPFDLVLHIGAEICEALEHAHTSRGPDGRPMALVHRDVSPSNVLLSRAGEVKLTDFGIAKRAEQDATQGGAVRGKFAYISPEQARNEPLDPRSDVFSVGILMWELICNRRLFSGLDDLAALRSVREATVPRPSEIDGRLPPEIDQILMTALAKDKTRRHATTGQLGQKLRSLRYSLDQVVGDPASELAKLIDSTEELERQSQKVIAPRDQSGRFDFDGAEATVIRIRTADAFSAREDQSISQARLVIDRFEEEETRLANLSGDQMRMLRTAAPIRDSGELTAEGAPPARRARRDSDSDEEKTRAREPLDLGKLDDGYQPPFNTPGEDTRLIAPRDRRTPVPGMRTASPSRSNRPSTVPPPMPLRGRGPTPGPPLPGLPMPPQMTGNSVPGMAPLPPTPQPQPLGSNLPMGMNNMPMGGAMPMQGAPPFAPSQPAGGYAGWAPPIAPQIPTRDATPTAQDSFDQPLFPPRATSMPQVAGFGRTRKPQLKPWVLVVGAIVMALIAFAITRAFIG